MLGCLKNAGIIVCTCGERSRRGGVKVEGRSGMVIFTGALWALAVLPAAA